MFTEATEQGIVQIRKHSRLFPELAGNLCSGIEIMKLHRNGPNCEFLYFCSESCKVYDSRTSFSARIVKLYILLASELSISIFLDLLFKRTGLTITRSPLVGEQNVFDLISNYKQHISAVTL